MKTKILLFLLPLMIALMPCGVLAGDAVTFEGGDGSSIAKAVVIKGANEQTGVEAEYAWLAKHFPGYKMGKQALTSENGKSYDVMDFTTADGKKMTIYFDITDFFGKM